MRPLDAIPVEGAGRATGYNCEGGWIIEGYGVDPDIEVVDDPAAMAKGEDPQLERAVEEVMKSLKQVPTRSAPKPAYPLRAN